jgi:hypothetical protein
MSFMEFIEEAVLILCGLGEPGLSRNGLENLFDFM